jgi:hypothetical protein
MNEAIYYNEYVIYDRHSSVTTWGRQHYFSKIKLMSTNACHIMNMFDVLAVTRFLNWGKDCLHAELCCDNDQQPCSGSPVSHPLKHWTHAYIITYNKNKLSITIGKKLQFSQAPIVLSQKFHNIVDYYDYRLVFRLTSMEPMFCTFSPIFYLCRLVRSFLKTNKILGPLNADSACPRESNNLTRFQFFLSRCDAKSMAYIVTSQFSIYL